MNIKALLILNIEIYVETFVNKTNYYDFGQMLTGKQNYSRYIEVRIQIKTQ